MTNEMNIGNPYKGTFMPEIEGCLHLDITDEGVCIQCNTDIASDEFLDSLPEVPSTSNLGDLLAIVKLARSTVEMYLIKREENRDPANPVLFKLRTVGSQIVRLPDTVIWTELLQPSYIMAKELGYRSSFDRWSIICKDYLDELKEE